MKAHNLYYQRNKSFVLPIFLQSAVFVGTIATILLWLTVSSLMVGTESYLYTFLFRCWPIQLLNSWLFFVAILFVRKRILELREENKILQQVKIPTHICRKDVPQLLREIPEEHGNTMIMQRIRRLLQAFLYGEDVVHLNEALSRQDMEDIERGEGLLASLRHIIPVLGFFGTVIGLSLAMSDFSGIFSDLRMMKENLGKFAANLGVAFDTTLLALGYSIIITFLMSFLNQRKEKLVCEVNKKSRELLQQFDIQVSQENVEEHYARMISDYENLRETFNNAMEVFRRYKEKFVVKMEGLTTEISNFNNGFGKQIIECLRENGEIMAQKLSQIKEEIQTPRQYQITVQPVNKGGEDEQR